MSDFRQQKRLEGRNLVYFGSKSEIPGAEEASMLETVSIEEQVDEVRPEPRWELAECTCPDWCERDHERD